MARKEKFGKFVLLEEVETSGVGVEYRAAKLADSGLEKVVTVLRLKPELSAQPDAVKALMDHVKFAAQLQNPNVVKTLGIGKVEQAYYVSYEFLEAKSLKAIFARCRQDGFPLSADHALLIASKVCSALEYAHTRKTEDGSRYFHGLVTPGSVLVSYEGEVRTRGFGYWPARVRELDGIAPDEAQYLAPEQAAGGNGDHRSDVFAAGALLFEMLTGQPLAVPGAAGDPVARVQRAKLQNPTTDDDALPKPVRDILVHAVAADPAGRYGEIMEMRKAVDTLLFSGDFTPTTFNLAFFMHSLFREDIEREARLLKEERDASYGEFLATELSRAAAGASAGAATTAATVGLPAAATAARASLTPTPVSGSGAAAPASFADVSHAAHPPTHAHEARDAVRDARHTPVPAAPGHAAPGHAASGQGSDAATDATAGFTFHQDAKKPAGSKLPIIVVAALILVAVGAFFALRGRGLSGPGTGGPATPAPTTLSAEAIAAMAKVRELEEKLQELEAEKAAAAAEAEEEARKKMEAQAAARGQAVDPAAMQRAREEARRKAEAEAARQQKEEQERIAEEQRLAEERLAEERRKQEEEAARVAAAATTLPPTTTLPPSPSTRPGALVNINDAGVIAPISMSAPPLQYPPIALKQRIEGKVELSILVDEKGNVVDAKVVSAAGGRAGLAEAALDNARRRKYRPAMKDGVNVKVWTPITVNFVLPD